MKLFVNGTGNISPQRTRGHLPLLDELVEYTGNRLSCEEPDYKTIIDIKMIRRMSRIVKMGVASALECLSEAAVVIPDAIVTGTSYGCMQDTGLFLLKMVTHQEELLTPTPFIQSTHNTIGAQIALLLHCHTYNNTFVHRGFSFESALLDSKMLIMEKPDSNVLVGAIDEITEQSHAIINRTGMYKQGAVSNADLLNSGTKGTIAGEGSCFFLLSGKPSVTTYARLDAFTTFYKPVDRAEIEKNILSFLASGSVGLESIDVVITGKNGDLGTDQVYDQLQKTIFNQNLLINYKHLCGEYPTSSAFALWLAVNIVKDGFLPRIFQNGDQPEKPVKKILIYTHYQNIHHSLLLVSAC